MVLKHCSEALTWNYANKITTVTQTVKKMLTNKTNISHSLRSASRLAGGGGASDDGTSGAGTRSCRNSLLLPPELFPRNNDSTDKCRGNSFCVSTNTNNYTYYINANPSTFLRLRLGSRLPWTR